jgi:hypothetical protein
MTPDAASAVGSRARFRRRAAPVLAGVLVGFASIVPTAFPTQPLLETLVIAQASLLAIVISVSMMSMQVSTNRFATQLSQLYRESSFNAIVARFGLSILLDLVLFALPTLWMSRTVVRVAVVGAVIGVASWAFVSLLDIEDRLLVFLNPEPVLESLVDSVSFDRYHAFSVERREEGLIARNPILEVWVYAGVRRAEGVPPVSGRYDPGITPRRVTTVGFVELLREARTGPQTSIRATDGKSSPGFGTATMGSDRSFYRNRRNRRTYRNRRNTRTDHPRPAMKTRKEGTTFLSTPGLPVVSCGITTSRLVGVQSLAGSTCRPTSTRLPSNNTTATGRRNWNAVTTIPDAWIPRRTSTIGPQQAVPERTAGILARKPDDEDPIPQAAGCRHAR